MSPALMEQSGVTDRASTPVQVERRPTPYPYRAMLAVCSDLDLTPDARTYHECLRFLNTSETTSMGQGLGLEVGNTIYFDMAPDQFAYWNTDDAGRAMVRRLIRSGHIDCLHSFGDLAATRAQAARSLDDLDRHDCRLAVWIDHAVAPSNFGADIMCGSGDVPGSPVYHADLSAAFGIRYVWRGRVTSVTGQNVPRRLGGIFDPSHPVASAVTLARETAKGVLARRGHPKYVMHAPNAILKPVELRDGRPMVEFLRFNPHWAGVNRGETAMGLSEALTRRMCERLVRRGGIGVFYTHLGKFRQISEPFEAPARDAFRMLARFQADGEILVTTTRRLLDYCAALERVQIDASTSGDVTDLHVTAAAATGTVAPEPLDGLTVYVRDPARTRVFVDGRDMTAAITRNAADETGRASVSFPWPRLQFPAT